jgi:pre-mRNA-processing factor 39
LIFKILGRIVQIPMHQYARYFEKYRAMAGSRPLFELVAPEELNILHKDLVFVIEGRVKSELEIERDLRARIDNIYLEGFTRTQAETTKRWTFEAEIKRPYFHVTELDESQLVNWRKYLDFEEAEGDYSRTVFLYERCLVATAYYDEFWLRYARWMSAQADKEEDVRNVYARAACLYCSIANPEVRLQYARFEEATGRIDVSRAIHEAILDMHPGHLETIVSWANLERRQGGVDAAIHLYKTYIESHDCDINVQGALVSEWARLLWKIKGSVEEARDVFKNNRAWYLGVSAYWVSYMQFELQQPTSAEIELEHYERLKQLHDFIRSETRLSRHIIKELSHHYMVYLLERGTKDAAKEYMLLDKEANG